MKKEFRKDEKFLFYVSESLIEVPSPSSISYLWNFGSLLGIFLVFQIVTGLFLSIHFSGDSNLSFSSVIHIMRDVEGGWMIRVIHSNGASMFFMFLYFHIGRGLYYGSYKMKKVWMSGVTIFLLSMATAFLGYVLPWGQMSFWAATVITNLLSAIPYVGVSLVEWVWGGYAVGNPTLIRFFSFHFILPFIIIMLVIMHLVYLHEDGSSNPLGMESDKDKISFHPYFSMKDVWGIFFSMMILLMISFHYPYAFMDSENFIVSNPLVTPVHIQPEWYFLFVYSILRSISNKIGGVVALLFSIFILYFYPLVMKQKFQAISLYMMGRFLFWMMFGNWMLLTWMGAQEVEDPYVFMSEVMSMMYFFLHFSFWVMVIFQDKFLK